MSLHELLSAKTSGMCTGLNISCSLTNGRVYIYKPVIGYKVQYASLTTPGLTIFNCDTLTDMSRILAALDAA